MNFKLTSPIWSWLVMIFAVGFIIISGMIIRKVNLVQSNLGETVSLINDLNQVENTIRLIEKGVIFEKQNPTLQQTWESVAGELKKQMIGLSFKSSANSKISFVIPKLEEHVKQMQSARSQMLQSTDSIAKRGFMIEFHQKTNDAVDIIRQTIYSLRNDFGNISRQLARYWKFINLIVLISCVIAIGAAILMKLLQNEIAKNG